MKEIKAIIQPFMLEAVLSALDALPDLPGLTISDVRGWGKTPGRHEGDAAPIDGHASSPKVKLEIIVRDEQEKTVVEALVAAARTGRPGDGKVFVLAVDEVVKIRTGDCGCGAV